MSEQPQPSKSVDRQKIASLETIRALLDRKGTNVWHVAPSSTVFAAIAEMADRGVGALPVVLEGRLVGIISERDYARKVILQGRSSHHTTVHEIMTPLPITVTPDHTVDQCLRIMTLYRVRHLPVLEAGVLAGIVSIGDLVSAVIATQEFTIDQLQTYIAVTYPG